MSEKAKCIIAYVFGWVGGVIILFAVQNNDRDTRFHAAQAIVISAAYFILVLAYSILPFRIPFFSSLLWIAYIVCIIFAIVRANQGGSPELPVVGKIAQSIFGKKIDG